MTGSWCARPFAGTGSEGGSAGCRGWGSVAPRTDAVTNRAYDGLRNTTKSDLDGRNHPVTENTETAILAGGCFWGVQELLRKRDGVISTRVGYTGGENENATYGNHPGHAEPVEIVFDHDRISYRDIIEFFFQIHDPPTIDRP